MIHDFIVDFLALTGGCFLVAAIILTIYVKIQEHKFKDRT